VDAQRLMTEAERLDARSLEETNTVAALNTDLPAGSAQVWLPELVKKHFANAGLDVSIVRLNSIHEIPETRNFHRGYWSVGVPVDESGKNIRGLLTAVAQFERQNAFVRVLDFSIVPDPENPGKRLAGMNVTTLVAQ
jgi:hypothetical protein